MGVVEVGHRSTAFRSSVRLSRKCLWRFLELHCATPNLFCFTKERFETYDNNVGHRQQVASSASSFWQKQTFPESRFATPNSTNFC